MAVEGARLDSVFVAAPFRRSAPLYLFGGETAVAFVFAAKLGCEARRENGIARTFRYRYREAE